MAVAVKSNFLNAKQQIIPINECDSTKAIVDGLSLLIISKKLFVKF